MSNLELLRPAAVFATVVEEGSFRAAAVRLDLSAPYISQLVADLETRLGRQLLYRSTRKLALSADGERFLPIARQIAWALRDGLAEFRSDTQELVGKLRLSAPTILATPFFSRLLAEFQALHPQLDLTVLLDDQSLDPMDQQTDLTIRVGNAGADSRPARKLFQTRGVICASGDMARRIQSPEALATERWIKTPAMQSTLTLSECDGDGQITVSPDQIMTSNSGQLTSQLAAQGAGWAIFPEFAVREAMTSGRLTHALTDWQMSDVGVYALYSARHSSLSNARGFVEFLSRKLG